MDSIDLIDCKTRENWLSSRANGIGASESAALFGLSPFTSEFALWSEKAGFAPPVQLEGEWLEWGHLLEEPIATFYAKKTNRTVWTPPSPYCVAVHPRLPFLYATVDRWIVESEKDGTGDLEIKNVSAHKADDWEDAPPLHVQAQVQHQLACTGMRWASIAGLIGGNNFRHFDVERDDAFIAELEAKAEEFWTRVQRKEAPPVDGSEATTRAIKRMHPLDDGSEIVLSREIEEMWTALQSLKERRDQAKADAESLENEIRAAMGPATFGILPTLGRRLTLKHQTRKAHVVNVPESTFRALKIESEKKPRTKGSKS